MNNIDKLKKKYSEHNIELHNYDEDYELIFDGFPTSIWGDVETFYSENEEEFNDIVALIDELEL